MKTNNMFGPVLLDGLQAASIHQALVAAGNIELASIISSKAKRTDKEALFVSAARCALDGDLEIDEDPVVSFSEQGAYVMAWHWVSDTALIDAI